MNIAKLIARRRADGPLPHGAGSLRDMAARARVAGYQISHSTLGELANGRHLDVRNKRQVAAVAAAIGVSVEEVRAAALEGLGASPPDGSRGQYAEEFLRLTNECSDEEIEAVLGVVAATLRAMRHH